MHDGPVIVNNTPLVALWTLRRLDLFQVYPLIQELQAAGIFFSASLVTDVLVLADESD